jgi:RNA-directed DNA polymerase
MKRHGYQPSPLRRVYIPKADNKKKLRSLDIPSIADTCQQALYAFALVPVSEVTEFKTKKQ